MEPILVTGTSGLVGFEVARALQQDGADVLGLDIRPPADAAPFRHITGDGADLATMMRAIEGRPNVVHAGAVSGPMLMLDDPGGIARANLGGAMAVFEACRQQHVRRLVWTSSIAVYGDQPTLDTITEDTRPNPQSFYGHTKAAGEILLHAYTARYGLPAVVLRMSSVFGVRRQTACGLRRVIAAGLERRPVEVASEGSSFRQYLHVGDAAQSVLLALRAPAPSFVYNITGGTYVSEAAIAGMIAEMLPGLAVIDSGPAWNEGHLGPLAMDLASRELAYVPTVTLRDGLTELLEHERAGR